MTEPDLPTPAEVPHGDIVIFDGQCQFCRRQVKRLHQLDRGKRLAFVSLHDDEARRYAPDLSHDQLMEQMYVRDPRGELHGGAAAFRYLTRRLPALWPLAPLLHIPFSLPLWQALYRQVANRRYRWNKAACDQGTCHIHFH